MHPESNYLLKNLYVPIYTLFHVAHAVHCNCAPYMDELGDIYIPRQFKALRHTMSRQNSYRRDVGKDPEKIVVIAM